MPSTVRIRFVRKNGEPITDEQVGLIDATGSVRDWVRTDASGIATVPADDQGDVFVRIGSPNAEPIRIGRDRLTAGGPVVVSAAAGRPAIRMYGQLVDRSGQPAAGVGVVIRRQDGTVLGATVSDSNGAFVAIFARPQREGEQYAVELSVNKKALPLPDLAQLPPGLFGPHTFVVEKTLPRGLERVAPRPVFMRPEDEMLGVIKESPHLFSRHRPAVAPDACYPETPGEVPARIFYLQQFAQFAQPDQPGPTLDHPVDFVHPVLPTSKQGLRYGALLEFRQEWWDLGYTLGDLLYSVPLAPCEETKIAAVDWRRRDYAKKQTALDESHFQDTTISRDETVAETMRSSSTRHVTDTTLGGGISFPLGEATAGISGSITNMDGATSSGTDASRSINDRVRQTSNTLRSTRAFAITEVLESEQSVVTTRVLRNHNHCHTVTFQYFEVVRHFLISTKLNRTRPAIFVPFSVMTFKRDQLLQHGYLLRRALLDSTLESAFDILLGVRELPAPEQTEAQGTQPKPPTASPFDADKDVTAFRLSIFDPDPKNVYLGALNYVEIDDQPVEWVRTLQTPPSRETWYGNLPAPVRLSSIKKVAIVGLWPFPAIPPEPFGADDVSLEANVDGQWTQLLYWPSLDIPLGHPLASSGSQVRRHVQVIERSTAPGTPSPSPSPTPPKPTPQEIAEARLIDHLNANAVYYTAAIISGGDAGLRYLALSGTTDGTGRNVADIVENSVAGTMGNYLVFPLKSQDFLPAPYRPKEASWLDKPPDERLISLPTPGVFAESQLGRCSACEKIDNTRFWDWQKSPCPEDAPNITSDMLASRYQSAADLIQVVKSNLAPTPVQIPEQPPPLITIGDATLKELTKNLDLKTGKDVVDLVKGLIDGYASGVKKISDAAKSEPPLVGPTDDKPDPGDDAGLEPSETATE